MNRKAQAAPGPVLVASNGVPAVKTAHAQISILRASATNASFFALPRDQPHIELVRGVGAM